MVRHYIVSLAAQLVLPILSPMNLQRKKGMMYKFTVCDKFYKNDTRDMQLYVINKNKKLICLTEVV